MVEAEGEVEHWGGVKGDVRERGVDVSLVAGLCGCVRVGVVARGSAAKVIRPEVGVAHCKGWKWGCVRDEPTSIIELVGVDMEEVKVAILEECASVG